MSLVRVTYSPASEVDDHEESGTPRISCYICMESTPPLIRSPCECRTLYMHPACQMRFLQHSGNFNCSVCATPYTNTIVHEQVHPTNVTKCLVGHVIASTLALTFVCSQLMTTPDPTYANGIVFVVINISVACMLTLSYLTDTCMHRYAVAIHV